MIRLNAVEIRWTDEHLRALRDAREYMDVCGVEAYFIVGGFLRDAATGRAFKDVDVFVPGTLPIPDGSEELEYDLSQNAEVVRGSTLVNVIYMQGSHTVGSLIRRCDVGICQIGMGTDGVVWATDEYVQDVARKTLTVTRTTRWGHLDRVIDKFPDHALVDRFNNHSGVRNLGAGFWNVPCI